MKDSFLHVLRIEWKMPVRNETKRAINRATDVFQWSQLLALMFVHLLVDLFAGMLPALLPVIRKEFDLSLSRAVVLLTLFGLVANGIQIVTGPFRSGRPHPVHQPHRHLPLHPGR